MYYILHLSRGFNFILFFKTFLHFGTPRSYGQEAMPRRKLPQRHACSSCGEPETKIAHRSLGRKLRNLQITLCRERRGEMKEGKRAAERTNKRIVALVSSEQRFQQSRFESVSWIQSRDPNKTLKNLLLSLFTVGLKMVRDSKASADYIDRRLESSSFAEVRGSSFLNVQKSDVIEYF